MSWRDVKARARAVVHDTMKVPVAYLTSTPDSNSFPTPPTIYARLHLDQASLGDQPGTNLNSAERYDFVPTAIFWLEELEAEGISLDRGHIISVADGEAYRVGVVHPTDVETVTVDISRMSASAASGLPLPEVE